MKECNHFAGIPDTEAYADKLKSANIRDWDVAQQQQAILAFASLTMRIHHLRQ